MNRYVVGGFNPSDTSAMERLTQAIRFSNTQLEDDRAKRTRLLKKIAGPRYTEEGAPEGGGLERQPVNHLAITMEVYGRSLVAADPRVMMTSAERTVRPRAKSIEALVNDAIACMRLGETLRQTVYDALVWMGITVTQLGPGGDEYDLGDGPVDIGKPCVYRVDFDDFVYDTNARSFEECEFIGHRIVMSMPEARQSGKYDQDLLIKAKRDASRRPVMANGEYAEEITGKQSRPWHTVYDQVEFQVTYLPLDSLIITTPINSEAVLAVEEWHGPESAFGPYDILRFGELPNNIRPKPPLLDLSDLHMSYNRLMSKIIKQGIASKTVFGVRPGGEHDANRVKEANDGEIVRTDDPQHIAEMRFGGIDGQTASMLMHLRDVFSWSAGNLDLLGGLSPSSETASQDQMLAQTSSKKLQEMQDRTLAFTTQVCRKVAYLLWTDPVTVYQTTKRSGANLALDVSITPEERVGTFDFDVEVHPFSLRSSTPAQKMRSLMQVYQQLLFPNMQMLAAHGYTIDFPRVLKMVAEWDDFPELEDTLIQSGGIGLPDSSTGLKPPMTTRRYERINRSGSSRSARDGAMMQMMAGKGVQPKEMGPLARPNG